MTKSGSIRKFTYHLLRDIEWNTHETCPYISSNQIQHEILVQLSSFVAENRFQNKEIRNRS